MKILYLTFYFEPDLCAGSFRNTPLVEELARQLTPTDHIHVVTTQPNRYQTFRIWAAAQEQRTSLSGCPVAIDRISLPRHASGLQDQIRCFTVYYQRVLRLTRRHSYDRVVASSSRLFTAFLAAQIARQKGISLFLDIRDLFRENIQIMIANALVQYSLDRLLSLVERYTFGYADHINLVSHGFQNYFATYRQAGLSFYPNGIDDLFLNLPASQPRQPGPPYTLVYAGNIGEGQGLHKVIPQAARQLGPDYQFVVVGDGGARTKLIHQIATEHADNVAVRNPVKRDELLALYQQADYLFLHLNDFDAFERVLPSKLFEYAATDKPILAGVGGYARQFIREHVDNCFLFDPGDVDALVHQLRNHSPVYSPRVRFCEQFQRKTIMRQMARCILQQGHKPHSDSSVLPLRSSSPS